MKKISKLLFVLLIMLGASKNVSAQLPSVDLVQVGDTAWFVNCSIPDTASLFFYGYAPGYLPTDSIHMNINFGDGTSLSYYVNLVQGGTTFYGTVNHVYTLPGAYAVQFIATGPDGSADTLVDPMVLMSASCAPFSGRLFLDSNSDCIFNVGETPVQAWVVASYNGTEICGTMSNALGEYFLSVPDGFGFTYTITPNNTQLTTSCPVSGGYTVTTLPSAGNDFSFVCNPIFDYACSIGGQGFRANAISWLWLNAWNQIISCAPPNATVTLTLDPMLSYDTSSVTPISVSGTQVVFNAGQLSGYSSSNLLSYIQLLTNPAAAIGDTLCITLTVDPQTGDQDPTDNVYTACLP